MADSIETSSTDERLSVLAKRIRDSEGEVPEHQVADWADELGVPSSNDSDLRRRLTRKFNDIHYSRISKSFVWDAARPQRSVQPEPQVIDLCNQWLQDLAGDDSKALRERIQQRVASSDATPEEIAVARAVGAADGKPDWSEVPCRDDLPAALIDRFIEHADPVWLLEAATTLSSRRADPPRKKLDKLAVFERNELAADAVTRWTADSTPGRSTSRQLRRLKAAIGGEFTPLFMMTVARAAERLIRDTGGAEDEETERDLAALAFLLAAVDREMAVEAINNVFDDATALRQWVLAVVQASKSAADRVALLSAIGASERSSAIFDPSVYRGLDLELIGQMLSQPDFEHLLERGLGDHVRPAIREAMPRKLGPALDTVARYPTLEGLVPLELLTTLLSANEVSSRVARRATEQLVSDAVAEERKIAHHRITELTASAAALDAQLASAREELRVTEARRAAAESKWREAINQSGSARSAELRQAQIDALRALAENIEDTRSVLATLESSALVDQHLLSSTRRIEAFGVVVEGHPGDTVSYEPQIHHPIDVEAGTDVELLTPVYRLADSVTPLRYGLVRRVPPGT